MAMWPLRILIPVLNVFPPVVSFGDGYRHARFGTSVEYCDHHHTGLAYRAGVRWGLRYLP